MFNKKMFSTKRLAKSLLAAATLFSASTVFAQSETTTTGRMDETYVGGRPTGFVPFLGLGAGYTSSDNRANVQEGAPANVKLIGSIYDIWNNGVLDLGYGLSNQQFSRTEAGVRAITDPTMEIAARQAFASRWQAGVVYNQLFGRGEFYQANQADAQFAGLQALKEFDIGKAWLGRIGGRLMADVNVPNQTVGMAMIDLQMGWNPSSRRQSVSKANYVPPARPVAAARPNPTLPSVMAEIGDRPGFVHFDLNSADIKNADRRRLAELAQNLEKRDDLYQSIEVVGHADPSGLEPYNQALSERRAEQVKQELVQAGWPSEKITTVGRGETEPVVLSMDAPNFGDNRRVEIRFNGVQNEEELRKLIASAE